MPETPTFGRPFQPGAAWTGNPCRTRSPRPRPFPPRPTPIGAALPTTTDPETPMLTLVANSFLLRVAGVLTVAAQ